LRPVTIMPTSPNILIICVDEMRADHMGPAGNAIVRTPNLDRLAARGTTFTRGYCNNPICMPARASMFTGLLPRDHGVRINGQALRKDLPTLPGVLASAGDRTHSAGKLHLTPWVTAHPSESPESLTDWNTGAITTFPTPYYGFQTVDFVGGHTSFVCDGPYFDWVRAQGGDPAWLQEALEPPTGAPSCYKMRMPEELHYNRFITDSAIRVIEAKDDAPFFVWCSFPDPHAPVAPPRPYCDLYNPADMPLPARREGELDDLPPVYRRVLDGELRPNGVDNTGVTDDHWREIIAGTYGMITHVDAEIGRVLDALERSSRGEETIVVFIADHGDMMGDHGLLWKAFYTFRGCINIPYIVAAPGMPGGRVSDALVSQIDLMPGLLDLCGVPMPGADWADILTPFERGSVMPLANYPGQSFRGLLDGAVDAIRDGVVIENDDPTAGFRVRALVTPTHRLSIYPGTADGELFDLRADPDERYNLWYRPAEQELRARLVKELLDQYSLHTPLYPIPAWNA
jgi:arylsulfatase A-like enzyme